MTGLDLSGAHLPDTQQAFPGIFLTLSLGWVLGSHRRRRRFPSLRAPTRTARTVVGIQPLKEGEADSSGPWIMGGGEGSGLKL